MGVGQMKWNQFFAGFISILLFMVGCANDDEAIKETKKHTNVEKMETSNPDTEEILSLEPDADIFKYNEVIYMTNIDWIDELSLTKDSQIGEIKTKNETNTDFENEMSNKLPVGAKIYSAKERGDILIVEFDEHVLRYLAIVEG